MLGLNAWISMDIDISYHLFSFLGHFHWCQGVKAPILLATPLSEKREHFMFVIYLGHPWTSYACHLIYNLVKNWGKPTSWERWLRYIKIGFGWSLGPKGLQTASRIPMAAMATSPRAAFLMRCPTCKGLVGLAKFHLTMAGPTLDKLSNWANGCTSNEFAVWFLQCSEWVIRIRQSKKFEPFWGVVSLETLKV